MRRHPWRKSHLLQVGQALRRAKDSHPWLLLIKLNSPFKTLGFLPCGGVTHAIASVTESIYASQQKAPKAISAIKASSSGLLLTGLSPPTP
jgi:hypothetical protein